MELFARVLDADGVGLTTSVTAYFLTDGSRSASAGTLSHVTGGIWQYTPSAGELASQSFAIEFSHASAFGGGPIVGYVSSKGVVDASLTSFGTAKEATVAARATPSDVAAALTAYGAAKPSDLTGLATTVQLAAAVYPLALEASVAGLPDAEENAAELLAALTTGHAYGTIGWAIAGTKTEVDSLVSRSQVVLAGPATITTGDLTLVRGDTYSDATIPITRTLTGQPDLTNAAVMLTIRDASSGEVLLSIEGEVITAGAGITQEVKFETAEGDTDSLAIGLHPFDVEAEWTTGEGEAETVTRWTLWTGLASIIADQTRHEVVA